MNFLNFNAKPTCRPDSLQKAWPIHIVVIGSNGELAGVVTRKDIQGIQERIITLAEAMKTKMTTAFPDEPLRLVVYRMAETGLTRMPVVERDNPSKLVGMIFLTDLLRARTRNLEEERHRERVLRLRLFPLQLKVAARR